MGKCFSSKEVSNNPGSNLKISGVPSKSFEVKIVVLGEPNVGKSSITLRYCKSQFNETYSSTIGGAFLQKQVSVGKGDSLKMNIWDTGGSERFRSMASLYYKGASAALLVYDITNESTLTNLNYWIDQLKNQVEVDKMILCLAGNKCDVNSNERKISQMIGKEFSQKNGLLFFETSAKTNTGINELFNSLAQEIYDIKLNKKS